MTKRFEATVEKAASGSTRRTHTDGRKIYRAVATTPALDRYGEVVLPKGAIVEHFMKNPVLLDGHDYRMSSIGHVVDLHVSKKSIEFDFVFSNDTRGQELEQKFADGDMNAFSIGFKPRDVVELWSPWKEAPDVKEVKVTYPDGSGSTIRLEDYPQIPYRLYNQWELLEISTVSVPANPEALLLRTAENIIRRTMDEQPTLRSFVQEELAAKLEPMMQLLTALSQYEDGEIKVAGAVPKHSTPVEEGDWSGANARTALAKWASKDGTGKKEDMNWSKYSKGFAWFDSKNADSLGAYKLPHHTVKDGSLVAIWRGVTAAMAALMGARGGVDLNDKSAVYAHLAAHYKDFKKEPPVMKAEGEEYSEEELLAVENEPLVVEKTASPDNSESVEGEGAVAKADPPADDEDEDDGQDNMMAQVLALLKQISSKIDKLSKKNVEDIETQSEHFIELQIKTASICDLLELRGKKEAAAPAPAKKDPTEEVVADLDMNLIADLQRVAAIE